MRGLVSERGVALPVAVFVMGLLLMFTATVVAESLHLSDESNTDQDAKRALAAADAGVQAATYRMNKLAPSSDMCLTDVATLPVVGGCPPYAESLGNGASYTYRASTVLNTGDACAGLPVQYTQPGLTIAQRCVISTGTVNGVTRRVQARVAAFRGVPIFPAAGVTGLDSVKLSNSTNIAGTLASNGQITTGNSSSVAAVELGPSAPNVNIGNSSQVGQTVRRTGADGPLVLAPVDVGNSATVNDNQRIVNGIASPHVSPFDTVSGTTYTAATRTLAIGNSGRVTLGGGTYNFCKVTVGNSGHLQIQTGAKTRIFIDSPERAGSGCPAASGTLTVGNSGTFDNLDGNPENLQIYVYGWANGLNVVDLSNSGTIVGAIYAPQSKVVFRNSATINGAVAGRSVEFKNSASFNWVSSLGDLRARTLTLFYRTAWKQCTARPPDPQNPYSGC